MFGASSELASVMEFGFYQQDAIHLTQVSLSLFYGTSLFTFCVSRSRRRKMYCGHARLCVCLSAAVRPHCCTDPDVTWGRGRGCPLVVHYWAHLQSVHGLRCYGNITRSFYKLASITRYDDIVRTLGGVSARCWPVTGRRRGRSQHYCGGLHCGLPLVAFWHHNANAKC